MKENGLLRLVPAEILVFGCRRIGSLQSDFLAGVVQEFQFVFVSIRAINPSVHVDTRIHSLSLWDMVGDIHNRRSLSLVPICGFFRSYAIMLFSFRFTIRLRGINFMFCGCGDIEFLS